VGLAELQPFSLTANCELHRRSFRTGVGLCDLLAELECLEAVPVNDQRLWSDGKSLEQSSPLTDGQKFVLPGPEDVRMLDLLPEHLHDLLDLGSLVDVVLDLDRPLVVHERKAWECASRSFAPINGCSKIGPIWEHLGPCGPRMDTNGNHIGPQWAPKVPILVGPIWDRTLVHMGQKVPQRGPQWAQKGPKRFQHGHRRSQMGRSAFPSVRQMEP
jgi:hypothetical protein